MALRLISLNRSHSAGLAEADDFSVVAETLAAEEKIVLADETDLALAASALAAVLSELTGVSPPEQVGHSLW